MKIQALQVGPIGTNCYLLCDENAHTCAVIDPGAEPELILSAVEKLDCAVDKILLTHGKAVPLIVKMHRAGGSGAQFRF